MTDQTILADKLRDVIDDLREEAAELENEEWGSLIVAERAAELRGTADRLEALLPTPSIDPATCAQDRLYRVELRNGQEGLGWRIAAVDSVYPWLVSGGWWCRDHQVTVLGEATPLDPTDAQNLADMDVDEPDDLPAELISLLNRYSAESVSGTPDFILGAFLLGVVKEFNEAVSRRAEWRSESVDLPVDDHTEHCASCAEMGEPEPSNMEQLTASSRESAEKKFGTTVAPHENVAPDQHAHIPAGEAWLVEIDDDHYHALADRTGTWYYIDDEGDWAEDWRAVPIRRLVEQADEPKATVASHENVAPDLPRPEDVKPGEFWEVATPLGRSWIGTRQAGVSRQPWLVMTLGGTTTGRENDESITLLARLVPQQQARTLTTVDEYEDAPEGTIVVTRYGMPAIKGIHDTFKWGIPQEYNTTDYGMEEMHSPCTVLRWGDEEARS